MRNGTAIAALPGRHAWAFIFHDPTAAHEGRDYDLAEVSALDGETFGGTGRHARVVVEFTAPVPPAESRWPNEAVCAIGRESDDLTGIAWLLSLETGAIDCIPG